MCGAVRYEIAAEPMMAGHCQCLDCQHMTGTGHASYLAFPGDAVRFTGAPKFHSVKADSGNDSDRGFCANCGCFVVAKGSGMPGILMVTAGSLDEPSRFAPQLTVYASRANSWDLMDPALRAFPLMPHMGGPSVACEKAAIPPAS
jgi:hypothetical protein